MSDCKLQNGNCNAIYCIGGGNKCGNNLSGDYINDKNCDNLVKILGPNSATCKKGYKLDADLYPPTGVGNSDYPNGSCLYKCVEDDDEPDDSSTDNSKMTIIIGIVLFLVFICLIYLLFSKYF
jgi:hypothetical protein